MGNAWFRRGLAGAAAAALFVGSAAALATGVKTYTDADGLFHGCVGDYGRVRVVVPGASCQTRETAIQWHEVGPQGPPGPPGDQGRPGSARAWAQVSEQGIPYWRRNMNVSSVDHPEPGVYCVYVDPTIDMSSSVALVTVEGGVAEPRYVTAFVGCGPTGRGIQVNVFDGLSAEREDAAFYLMVP